MAETQIEGDQIEDGTISRDDLNIGLTGKAVIRKIIALNGVAILTSTGIDTGTGDVSVQADLTFLDTKYVSRNQTVAQNAALIGPTTGSGMPTFRALTAGDIPPLNSLYIAQGGNAFGTTMTIGTNDNNQIILKSNNINVAAFKSSGYLGVLTGIDNYSNGSYGRLYLGAVNNGMILQRDVPDSQPALYINNINASSTGNIVHFQFANATKAMVSQGGYGIFQRIGIGSSLAAPGYLLDVNAGSVSSSTPIAQFSQNGGSIQFANGTGSFSAFIPRIYGVATSGASVGLDIVAKGSDTYSSSAIALRAGNSGYTGGITSGNVLSILNYTTSLLNVDYLGNTGIVSNLIVGSNTTTITPFHAFATSFANVTPRVGISTGTVTGTYQDGILIRHASQANTAVLRETGLFIKLSDESSAGESGKGGAITMKSSNAFANTPDMNFYILNDASPKMTIYNGGSIGISNLAGIGTRVVTVSAGGTLTNVASLTVPNGGTGATSLTGIVIGNGTSAMTAIAGSASQLLRRKADNTGYEFFTASYVSSNFYTADGTLPSNRNVNLGGNVLSFTSGAFVVDVSDNISIQTLGESLTLASNVGIYLGNSTHQALFNTPALTSNINIDFPAISGRLAVESWVTAQGYVTGNMAMADLIQTADRVYDGNTFSLSLNNIYGLSIQTIDNYYQYSANNMVFEADGNISFTSSNHFLVSAAYEFKVDAPNLSLNSSGDGPIVLDCAAGIRLKGGTYGASLITSSLTATRTLGIQDRNGTVALDEDFVSGTYDPTITGSEAYNASVFTYIRLKNVVHVSGRVAVSVSGGGDHDFLISLPISSNITSDEDLSGVVTGDITPSGFVTQQKASIYGNTSTDEGRVNFSTDVNTTVYIQFDYIIH